MNWFGLFAFALNAVGLGLSLINPRYLRAGE